MKKCLFLLTVICLGLLMPALAQEPEMKSHRHRPPRPSLVFIKDDGNGAPVNFGIAFSPTFDWMYTNTAGYSRDGMAVGMRYGIPLNINLTHRKNYYVSTGVFVEHLGGVLSLRDKVVLPDVGASENSQIRRTYRTMYITIPVGITLKTNSLSNFFICGNVGFYNSFLLSANNIDACMLGGELWSRQKQKYGEAAVCKESVYAGFGFEYSVTPKMRAGITTNYVHTLTNFFKGRGQAYNDVLKVDPKAKFGYVEIEAHINFF